MAPTRKRNLLVVEDNDELRNQLKWAFDDYNVLLAEDRRTALSARASYQPAVALVDLGLPPDKDGPTEGLKTLQEILDASPEAKVIIMTGQDERAYALECVANGAYDYYAKPIDVEELALTVKRAFRMYDLEAENRRLRSETSGSTVIGLETCNARMRDICKKVEKFAKANVSVLIVGESGTGKELLAQAVHDNGGRPGDMIAINCAAIPENLLESELFGHEKGAFTGAHKTTPGKIEQAHRGTLFLDEIGDLSPGLQAKLLRVLQERSIERVGGRQSIPVDFRIVCATNKDLEGLVADGTFREDLYYRLGEITVHVPPLRERPDDIVLIARTFLGRWAAAEGLGQIRFSAESLTAMEAYHWPGNVRELQSRVKRAALASDGTIRPHHLGLDSAPPAADDRVQTLREARRDAELTALRTALSETNGQVSEAARLLDVSRPTLYQLLKDHNLKP